ncbi:VOC family protein [Rhodopila sp.]|uniref:VOC family protein n=1 Tax=Rhodopila sp. TaxID=2480087 RepID=UPI003D0AE77A
MMMRPAVATAGDANAEHFQVRRIRQICRVVSDLPRAEAFYRDALGFQTVSHGPVDPLILAALGLANAKAEEVVLRLGTQVVALVRMMPPGSPYPADSQSNDLWFQHLAIVVTDMAAAYDHLGRQSGWQPISQGGPQHLPPANGGVRAFKFRDPDGHPLELIWFPPGQGRAIWHENVAGGLFQGIDHSALSVASTTESLGFYQALGFHVSDRSLNQGPAQDRLDGLPDAQARITALRPASDTSPGLELLGYMPPGRTATAIQSNDVAADWVTIEVSPSPSDQPCGRRDPDGHRLILVGEGAGATGLPGTAL